MPQVPAAAAPAPPPWWLHGLAGGLAGLTVDAALYPLDTAKTWLQRRGAAAAAPSVAAAARAAATASAPAPARLRLYRGAAAALLGSAPSSALFFVVYEWCKARTAATLHARGLAGGGDAGGWLLWLAPAPASAVAEVSAIALRTPFEVVKQRLQAGLHARAGDALRALVAAGPSRGLAVGLAATVLRDVPFAAIQYTLHDAFKKALRRRRGGAAGALDIWQQAAAGAAAAATAAAATTPLDVIKTRLMTQRLPESGAAGAADAAPADAAPADALRGPRRYAGWRDAAVRIVREEGAVALLSGFRTRVVMLGLGGAIYLVTYDEAKRLLGIRDV